MTIPVIATKISSDILEAAESGGRIRLTASGIDPTVYENMTETAEKAHYLLAVAHKGTVSASELAAITASSAKVDDADVRLFLNTLCEAINSLVETYGAVRIETPFGVFETRIAGVLEHPAAAIDPEKNYVYGSFTPNDELQRVVRRLSFYNATGATLPFRVFDVRMSGKTEPFTAGDTLDVRGMSLKSTCTTSVVNTTSGIETQCVTAFVGSSLIKATLPDSLAAGTYKLRVAQDGITQVATTTFGVKAMPHNPVLTSFSQDVERLQEREITFDQVPIVLTGEDLSGIQTVEIWRYPNGYDEEHDYELTQLEQISSTATTITAVNKTNTSGHVDGLWWGKPVRIIAKWADGATAYIDATFHDDND